MDDTPKPDRLTRWRNKDPLSLAEAAALLCDAEPGLRFDTRSKAEVGERHMGERIATMQRDLADAIRAGELGADLVASMGPAAYRDTGETMTLWGQAARIVVPQNQAPVVSLRLSTIPRAALIGWARAPAQGLDPIVWREPPKCTADAAQPITSDGTGAAGDALAPKAEWTLLATVKALASLGEYPLTHPHSKEPGNVADAIVAKIEGLTKRQVKRRAVADWLRKARDLPSD